MLLGAYKINGTPVSEMETVNDSDLNGNPAFLVANTLPSSYQNISSIENWAEFGASLIGSAFGFKDWKCLQREIKLIALEKVQNNFNDNWDVLNDSERMVVCNYLLSLVPPMRFAQTVTEANERTRISVEFDLNNRRARGNWQSGTGRSQILRVFLFGKIGKENALHALVDVVKEGLLELYEGGIEGTEEDGVTGINDFLLARADTTYAETGLAKRDYPVLDGSGNSLQEVAESMVQIASNGMY